MYFSKVKKVISYTLSIILSLVLVSTGIVASADNTAADPAQPSAAPSGYTPSEKPPSGGAIAITALQRPPTAAVDRFP